MKNDPSRTFQDLADIRFLLGLPGIDANEIRGHFEGTIFWRNSMSSNAPDPAPAELSLKLTAEDSRAMRDSRSASQVMSNADYFRFLAQFDYSYESLLARPILRGERFRLVDK